jgi:peptidoglycan hydrolase-like amidase
MDPSNQHPNIPAQASYNAVDDSDIFQKYVWAWLEKTLKKWNTALSKTENKLIMYNWYVPVLPYFSCSAWFTFTAYEKRWRNDTPYLQSRFDLWICSDKKFSWHWVWLSWLWAERRAKNFWRSYTDILKYYYPWIEIVNL